jgi:hypothetical protein
MSVNALDPSRPVLSDPVQVADELRAIKARLVLDKTNIESLQSTLVVLSNVGAFGSQTMALTDLAAWATLVQQTAIGKAVFEAATLGVAQSALGITSAAPTVSVGANKWTIIFAGGVKINIITGTYIDGQTHTWQTAFTSQAFGILCTKGQDENGSVQYYSESNSGCTVSFDGSGSKRYTVLAIGI